MFRKPGRLVSHRSAIRHSGRPILLGSSRAKSLLDTTRISRSRPVAGRVNKLGTIPNGRDVTGKIKSQTHAPSPHDRDNPQASKRPESSKPYQSAAPATNNYASREAELKAHRATLDVPRTDR